MFKKGDKVQLKAVVPQGEVLELRFNDESEIEVLFQWNDGEVLQQRWFKQDDLEAV